VASAAAGRVGRTTDAGINESARARPSRALHPVLGFENLRALRPVLVRVLVDVGLVAGGTSAVAFVLVLVLANGGLAYDTHAYWLAARHVLDGATLYAPATVDEFGAFKYPPVFAQMFAPSALLPELLVAWVWRISGILCLRYMVRSWKAVVIACAFLPVLIELSQGNVTLQIGALLVFAMRDRRGAYLLPWAAALKFGPVLLVPYLWFRMPESRRPLVVGTAVFATACLLSWLAWPDQWSSYVSTVAWENASVMSGGGVIAIVPAWGGLDFVIRFAIAGVLALYAVRAQKGWLAFAAAAITCPVMAYGRLAPLVAWWRFRPGAEQPETEARQVSPGMAIGATSSATASTAPVVEPAPELISIKVLPGS
jgi:Glycosyltransferase family 87